MFALSSSISSILEDRKRNIILRISKEYCKLHPVCQQHFAAMKYFVVTNHCFGLIPSIMSFSYWQFSPVSKIAEDNNKDIDMNPLVNQRQKAKAILQERGNIQAQISTQIENAIANVIPSQVDASVRNYMSGHILHVHPAQSQTSSVPEQQYQLYFAMKANPQLQQQDIAIWLALQMKFERNTVLQTACRTPAVRPRDQDDPHDDAHPKGENSAKRQKTSEYEAYVSGHVHGIIYKNSKKEKRVMRHTEIHKFCNVALNRVLEGLKSYNNDVKYGYVQKDLTKDETEYLKLFEEEIEERLKHRRQMRRWEMYVNGRPLGLRRERPK
ncbi:hypothetical protein Tco_1191911 [Tanacetum coccineum]